MRCWSRCMSSSGGRAVSDTSGPAAMAKMAFVRARPSRGPLEHDQAGMMPPDDALDRDALVHDVLDLVRRGRRFVPRALMHWLRGRVRATRTPRCRRYGRCAAASGSRGTATARVPACSMSFSAISSGRATVSTAFATRHSRRRTLARQAMRSSARPPGNHHLEQRLFADLADAGMRARARRG